MNIIFPWEAPKLAVLAKEASLRAFETLRWGKSPKVVQVGYPKLVRPDICEVRVTLSYETSSPSIPKIHVTEVALKKDKGTWVPMDVNLFRSDGFFSYFRFEGERPRLSAAGMNPNYPDF